jgi:hypothetical protein
VPFPSVSRTTVNVTIAAIEVRFACAAKPAASCEVASGIKFRRMYACSRKTSSPSIRLSGAFLRPGSNDGACWESEAAYRK